MRLLKDKYTLKKLTHLMMVKEKVLTKRSNR